MDNDNSNKTPAEIIGYYYVVFQATFTGFVKCWMDGSDNYKYYSIPDFINLFKMVNVSEKVIYYVKNCLDTTNFYIWDVNHNRISQLRPQKEERSIVEEINKMNPFFVRDMKQGRLY